MTTAVIVDSTVLRTPRGEWNICGNSPLVGRLSLNSLSVCAITVRVEPNWAREPSLRDVTDMVMS